MLIITADSHLDHALPVAALAFALRFFAKKEDFFIETIDLPSDLPEVPCALHGPIVGEPPVPDAAASLRKRGDRPGASRICGRGMTLQRRLTVIAGPAEGGECVLYTAFGGPSAPREVWEMEALLAEGKATPEQLAESRAFWAEHALSA